MSDQIVVLGVVLLEADVHLRTSSLRWHTISLADENHDTEQQLQQKQQEKQSASAGTNNRKSNNSSARVTSSSNEGEVTPSPDDGHFVDNNPSTASDNANDCSNNMIITTSGSSTKSKGDRSRLVHWGSTSVVSSPRHLPEENLEDDEEKDDYHHDKEDFLADDEESKKLHESTHRFDLPSTRRSTDSNRRQLFGRESSVSFLQPSIVQIDSEMIDLIALEANAGDEHDGNHHTGGFYKDEEHVHMVATFTQHERITLSIVVFWFTFLSICSFLPISVDRKKFLVGLVTNVNSVIFYGAPLSTIFTVFKTRNSASIHRRTLLFAIMNSFFWSAYGIAIKDIWISIPNGTGLVLSLLQLPLCLIFQQKSLIPNNSFVSNKFVETS